MDRCVCVRWVKRGIWHMASVDDFPFHLSKLLGPALLTLLLILRDSEFKHRHLGIKRDRLLELVSQNTTRAGDMMLQVMGAMVAELVVQPPS